MKYIFFTVSGVGFAVSLFFSGYTLAMYAAGDTLRIIVFALFAATLQLASVLFAVLTSTKSPWFILPTVVMALLNIWATTAYGVSTFETQYVEHIDDSEYRQTLINRRDALLSDISAAEVTRDSDEGQQWRQASDGRWVHLKELLQEQIDAWRVEVKETEAELYAPSTVEDAPAKQTPVTIYVDIADKIGTEPLTLALVYYLACGIMLELIVTMFAAVGAAHKPKIQEEQAELPYEPSIKKADILSYIKAAWPVAEKTKYLPGSQYLRERGIEDDTAKRVLQVLSAMGVIKREGDAMITAMSMSDAIQKISTAKAKKL